MSDLFAHLSEDLTKTYTVSAKQVVILYARKDNRVVSDYTVLSTDDPITELGTKLTRMGFRIWMNRHDTIVRNTESL